MYIKELAVFICVYTKAGFQERCRLIAMSESLLVSRARLQLSCNMTRRRKFAVVSRRPQLPGEPELMVTVCSFEHADWSGNFE